MEYKNFILLFIYIFFILTIDFMFSISVSNYYPIYDYTEKLVEVGFVAIVITFIDRLFVFVTGVFFGPMYIPDYKNDYYEPSVAYKIDKAKDELEV